jgi:hypothetical protein
MATTNVGFSVTVDSNEATQSIKDLRAAIDQTTKSVQELGQQYGENSAEVEAAQKRLQKLQDLTNQKQEENNRRIDNAAKTITALSAAYGGVQGALELTGLAGEDTIKQLAKIQSALAIGDAVQNLAEFKDSIASTFGEFRNTAVKAFQAVKGAIGATGIGLLIVSLGLVAANFDKIKKAVLDFIPGLNQVGKIFTNIVQKVTDFVGITSEAERALASLEKQTKRGNEGLEARIKVLTAQGGKEKEIFELTKKQGEAEINALRSRLKTTGTLTEEEQKRFRDLGVQRQVLEAQENKRRQDAAKENAKAGADASKAASEQLKKDNEEKIAAEKEAQEKLANLRNELFLSTFKDENQKKKAELELAFIKEKDLILANTKIAESTRNELIVAARLKLNSDINAINQTQKEKQAADDAKMLEEKAKTMATEDDLEFAKLQKNFTKVQDDEKKQAAKDLAEIDKKIAKNETDLELEKSLLDQKDALLEEQFANSLITEEQYTANIEANAKARVDIAKKESEQKIALAQQTASALTSLSDIVGKETAAGKALAVSAALINTYLGITAGVKLGFPAAIPAVAIAAATGFSAVKNIIATKVPGSSSSGSAGNMTAPNVSAGAPITPPQPQAQTTTLDNQSINALGNQTARAYVVESDVTSSQQRMAAIQQRARFG